MAVLVACALVCLGLGKKLPTGFLPEEDQGYLMLSLQLPNASSLQRTEQASQVIERALAKIPAIDTLHQHRRLQLLSGVQSSYNDTFFIRLKEWKERTSPAEQAAALSRRLSAQFASLPQGIAFSITPPAIPGVGASGGFTFVLEDRAGKEVSYLNDNLQTFLQAARKRPELMGLSSTFLPTVPQVMAKVDRDKTNLARRSAERRLPDSADLHGWQLHQLFQPFWPSMARVRRGRGRKPLARREHWPVLRQEQPGFDGSTLGAD